MTVSKMASAEYLESNQSTIPPKTGSAPPGRLDDGAGREIPEIDLQQHPPTGWMPRSDTRLHIIHVPPKDITPSSSITTPGTHSQAKTGRPRLGFAHPAADVDGRHHLGGAGGSTAGHQQAGHQEGHWCDGPSHRGDHQPRRSRQQRQEPEPPGRTRCAPYDRADGPRSGHQLHFSVNACWRDGCRHEEWGPPVCQPHRDFLEKPPKRIT